MHKSCTTCHAKIQRNLIIQFQENNQIDCRRKGGADPISQDPSGQCQGSNKYNFSRLTFKSQTYRVRYLFYNKPLHHRQHAKNQLNSNTHSKYFNLSRTNWSHPFLTTQIQKSVKQLFAFLNLHQHAKNDFILSIHS